MDLVEILKAGVRSGCSDIHLSVGSPPLLRVAGQIVEIPGQPPLDAETCKRLVYSGLMDQQVGSFEAHHELDCSINVPNLSRFRMNVLRQMDCVEAVYRVIPEDIPLPGSLGLGPAVLSLAEIPRGLVLVCGPTGSGKSSTLACMIEQINQKFRRHILTIEDPIEYVYKRKRSIIRQREVGRDTETFKSALRQALRQDPDVILIGELRDLETVSLALTAAETGHLCFATLHTNSSAQAVDRIVDIFPSHQQAQVRVQLAHTLKGVISQTLLTRADGRGLIAGRELMIVNAAIASLIRDGKTHLIQNSIETGRKEGMYSMGRFLTELVAKGLVTQAEADSKVDNAQNIGSTVAGKAKATMEAVQPMSSDSSPKQGRIGGDEISLESLGRQ